MERLSKISMETDQNKQYTKKIEKKDISELIKNTNANKNRMSKIEADRNLYQRHIERN